MNNLKEKLKYGKKGITLIALVITIIVLLILAGVTIATLTGRNGILTNAQEASEKTEQSAIKEEFKILLGEYKILENSEGIQLEDFLNRNKILYTEKEGSNQYIVEYGKYEFVLDKNTLEILDTQQSQEKEEIVLVQNIKSMNYGDDVIGYTANGIDEWKIFYNDGNNVYLISKDYVDINNICEEYTRFTKR